MSTKETWLVKLKRTGFETVLSSEATYSAALNAAGVLNARFQTDEYYVEQWQSELSHWSSLDDARNAADMIRVSIATREATK